MGVTLELLEWDNHGMKILVQVFWCILQLCISRGRAIPALGREHLRPKEVWGKEEHYDLLSFRTTPGTFLKGKIYHVTNQESRLCFAYCCIFYDPWDCFDHRTAGERSSSFHEKYLWMLSHSHPCHGQIDARKKKITYTTLKFSTSSSSKDTVKGVERQARVGGNICNT